MESISDLEQAIVAHKNLHPGLDEDKIAVGVEGFDSVAPGEKVKFVAGELNTDFYNHPEIIESILRMVNPQKMLIHHYNRGTQMSNQERYRMAVHDYQKCIGILEILDIAPASIETDKEYWQGFASKLFNNFGFALIQLKRFEESIPAFYEALKYNPKSIYVHNNLGDAYRKMNKPLQAELHYNLELDINPDHPSATENLELL